MKYIYTLYIWTVGILMFAILALITVFFLQFMKPQKYAPVFKAMMQFLLIILFVRVKVNGKEHLDPKQNYLYIPNHISFIDPIVLTAVLPKHTVAIEEQRNFKFPIYGWLSKYYGNIPINRGSIISSKRSFDVARDRLKNGHNIIIFAEGGRTTDGKLRDFKKLPFRTAVEAGKSVMPIAMNGLYEMNHKGTFWITPHKIKVNIGPGIQADEVKASDPEILMLKTRNQMLDILDPHYKN